MKKNVGSVDRIIRVVLAAVLLILFLTKVVSGVLGIIFVVLAAILVLTSLINFCPLYLPFKISTRKKA